MTRVHEGERKRFYFQVVAALVPTMKDASAIGIAHLAADIVDAAIAELKRRVPERPGARDGRERRPVRLTQEEEVALRRKQLGLPEERSEPDDD